MTTFNVIVEKNIIIIDAIVEKKKTLNNIMRKTIKNNESSKINNVWK